MNDARLTLAVIREIIDAAAEDGLSIAERCALRAGLGTFIDEIEEGCLNEFDDVDPDVSDELAKLERSVDVCLGFDTSDVDEKDTHRAWASSSLATIENLMREKLPGHWQNDNGPAQH